MGVRPPGRPGARSGTGVGGPAMAPPDLVLALHGTRSDEGVRVARRLVDAVAAEAAPVRVRLGWADVLRPSLSETLAELGEVIVVPGFLTTGYHVTSDLPAAIHAAGGRARLAGHIGPGLIAAVADRLVQAGGPGDAVVLAAAGSKRAGSLAAVRAAAAELAVLVGRPVVPGFLTAAQPGVSDAVAGLRAAGHRQVTIAPYLLAPGVFTERLSRAGADRVADPVGVHPLAVRAITNAYWACAAGALDLVGLPDAPVTASGERIA